MCPVQTISHGTHVLESGLSRPQSDSDGSEPSSIIAPATAPACPPPPPRCPLTVDWSGLWRFHHNAARDASRPSQERRWHADQARRVRLHLHAQGPTSWDWSELCAAFRRLTQEPIVPSPTSPAAGGPPLT